MTARAGAPSASFYEFTGWTGSCSGIGTCTLKMSSSRTATANFAPWAPSYGERGIVKGDFDGDGRDDLAIGVPGEAVGSVSDAGYVNVAYGTNGGLDTARQSPLYQGAGGLTGAVEAGDYLGGGIPGKFPW